jgi:hypothetical protein
LQKKFAVAHYTYFTAPDDDGIEPDPILRDWTGHAADASSARDRWLEKHRDDRFLGQVERWSPDAVGHDHLLIFRVPASPFDLLGWLALLVAGQQPLAFVRGPANVHPVEAGQFASAGAPPTSPIRRTHPRPQLERLRASF